ncbi:lipopolysaccharide cholinephosphotransferase [Planomicrobium sp. HSC-17F08]|nr:lipopolysaccharide cholinephosphotransferase [Planomicrobium sp. HSC-17F08]
MVLYTPEVVYEVQKIQFEILCEIERICRKHDIKYTLCGGTLLGAIRHKGFIPWDDDMDIDMSRSEYEKFLEVANIELNKKYFVQNYKSDKNCLNTPFTKIRKNGTIFESEGQRHLDRHKGIAIDIFPIDTVPENIVLRRVHKETIALLQKLVAIKLKYNYYNDNNFKKALKITGSLLLSGISIYRIGKVMENVMSFFNNTDSELVSNTYSRNFYDKLTFNKSIYESIIYLEFWQKKFPAPKQWETILQKFYGDYMTPPPEEERWNFQHNIIRISFEEETN